MNEGRSNKIWWFAGGVAVGMLGYLAVRYPVESGTRLGLGILKATGARTHEIPWGDGTIRYLMVGRGTRPLVMVHGFGDSPESFALLVRALARDYRICLPILPGHPGSPAPAGLKIGHMVQALDAVILREFGAQRVHLYGNSMGGWVAALYAAAASERLFSLMLVNPAGRHGDFHPEVLVPSNAAEASAALHGLFGPAARHFPKFWHHAYARAMSQRSEPAVGEMMQNGPRLGEQLTRISVRTTVVIGAHDRVIPPVQSREIANLIGHAVVEEIPDGSHLTHLTDVSAMVALVRRHATELRLLN